MSKELKCFDRIKNYQIVVNAEKDEVKTIGELLPSSCNEVENALKALEIIKEKGISTCSVALHYDSYEEYSKSCFRQYNPLTQEEYDLLKEVLL